MPKSRYNHRTLNIKSELLDSLVMAYLGKAPATRAAVAEKCKVSKTTSGKVATALFECGFVTQRTDKDVSGRLALHLSLRDNVSVMIIDLSRTRYSMRIVTVGGECAFESHHDFDTDISYEDNLTVFLSRSGYKAKLEGHRFDAICVIYSDTPRVENATSSSLRAYLPQRCDEDKTLGIIRSVFGHRCVVYVSLSNAVSAAVKLGIISYSAQDHGASYLFAGTRIEAFHVHKSTVNYCNAGSLLVDSRSVAAIMEKHITHKELNEVLLRLINLLCCAFNPDSIIIGSDIYKIDNDTVAGIHKNLAECGMLCPKLILSTAKPSVIDTAATRLAAAALIRHYVSSTDERQ